MPSWFPTPMVILTYLICISDLHIYITKLTFFCVQGNATRTTMATPPPLPEEPPPIMDESEYEEIDHLPSQNGVRRGMY